MTMSGVTNTSENTGWLEQQLTSTPVNKVIMGLISHQSRIETNKLTSTARSIILN